MILDDVHLRDLLSSQLEPPPSALGAEPTLIKMGFPCGGGGGGADTRYARYTSEPFFCIVKNHLSVVEFLVRSGYNFAVMIMTSSDE